MRLDARRLAELRRALILDSASERTFDDLARLLSTTLDVPVAMVNMLDSDRDWFKACVGLQVSQSPAITSFCEVFFTSEEDQVVVEDTALDVRFKTHPLVVGPPFIRFYAAARLVVNAQTIGTLCVYDMRPRTLSLEQLRHLQIMAGAAVELLKQRGVKAA